MDSTLTLYQTVSGGVLTDVMTFVPSGFGPGSRMTRKANAAIVDGPLSDTEPKLQISHQDLSSDRRRSMFRIDIPLIPVNGVSGSIAAYFVLDINGLSLDVNQQQRKAALVALSSSVLDGSTATLVLSQIAADFVNAEV